MSTQSHDGFLAGCAVVERSLHLEEYTRTRPASAGSRPRSLLNKVANAAAATAAQLEDEPEPGDAEPWVLEGWGDGPSVSEAAQQAALRLAPYARNVPTTLIGLGAGGAGGGGRRVLSAGPGGRNGMLKASEARRKPGLGPPLLQGERRSPLPPQSVVATLAAAARRGVAMRQELDVGCESDVEEPSSSSAREGAAPAAAVPNGYGGRMSGTSSSASASGHPPRAAPPQAPSPQQRGAGPPSTRQLQTSLAAQLASRRTGPPARGGSERRDTSASGSTTNSPMRHCQPSVGDAQHPERSGSGTPSRQRGVSAEAHQTSAGRTSGAAAPVDDGSTVAARGMTNSGGRSESQDQHSPRASGTGPAPWDSPSRFSCGPGRNAPDADAARANGAHAAMPPPPPLPGLFPTGRRMGSFRADTGFSGWDPDAPAVAQAVQQQAQQSNLSLWIGPTGLGGGAAAVQAAPAVSGGRSASSSAVLGPGHGQPQQRREQLANSSRTQLGRAVGGASGPPDLSLVPERAERSVAHAGGEAARNAGVGDVGHRQRALAGRPPPPVSPPPPMPPGLAGRWQASPDAASAGAAESAFGPPPAQDALTEFCSGRSDVSSAGGSSSGAGVGGWNAAPVRNATGSGHLLPPSTVPPPIRITGLTKAPAFH